MAGSLRHIVADDGSFRMNLIENMRDAHEALEECHRVIAALLDHDNLVDACNAARVSLPEVQPVMGTGVFNPGWTPQRAPPAPAMDPEQMTGMTEERVARLLAGLHFNRKAWYGVGPKADRVAFLVEGYWPQWRDDAVKVLEAMTAAGRGSV